MLLKLRKEREKAKTVNEQDKVADGVKSFDMGRCAEATVSLTSK